MWGKNEVEKVVFLLTLVTYEFLWMEKKQLQSV